MLAAVTTAKTDVDRSTAIVNGRSQFYNQSATKTYEVEQPPVGALVCLARHIHFAR